jgi:hypothetical protein
VAQIEPNAATSPFGPPPTRIVFTTLFRLGLIRLTVPLDSFETQMLPAPYASAYGESPTLIRFFAALFVFGFTRVTEPLLRLATQMLPAPYVIPNGLLPRSLIRAETRLVAGSMRTSLRSSEFVVHTEPAAATANSARIPTCTLSGPVAPAAQVHSVAAVPVVRRKRRSRVTTTLRQITTMLR